MEKLLSLAICAILSFNASHLQAQEKTTLYYFDQILEDDILLGGSINNVSANGKYAVGYDDTFMDTGYVWNSTDKQLAMVETGACETALANDVDNEGTIIGSFGDEDGVYSPGYLKNGQWHALPVPADIKEETRKSSDYYPAAVAFSADSKIIGGCIYYNDSKFHPVLWIEGELKEFPELQLEGQGFYLYDINDDGSILTGWAENEMGERYPAIITNGKLEMLYKVDDESEHEYFVEGIASHIDSENNITGYIIDEDGITHGFMYNAKDGLKYISNGPIGCSHSANCVFGANGYMGDGVIIKDGKEQKLVDFLGLETDKYISTVMACSANANVLGGNGVLANEMGAFSVPYIIELSEADRGTITSILKQNLDKVSVSLTTTGQLFINGSYTSVEVYDTLGKCVIIDNQQGHIVNLGTYPSGIYIVRVLDGNQVQSFKVNKQ